MEKSRRITFHEHDIAQPITHNPTTKCEYEILYQLWHHKDCLKILEQTDLNTIHCPLQKEVIKVNKIQHEQAIATLESLAELL